MSLLAAPCKLFFQIIELFRSSLAQIFFLDILIVSNEAIIDNNMTEPEFDSPP